ncbi:MAG: FKBP-type peptidyl-prolyl cis-trans isomerase [Gammaproteobacteria bacterium]|nr:FKBP-type peptidyl-prolyl cis-trans isomerase [Gammaproteobacteria bacterium]
MSEYTTIEQRASYGVGRNMGDQLAANPFDGIDISAVQQGIADAFTNVDSKVSMDELNAAFKKINESMQAAAAEKSGEMAAEGEAYLAENAKRAEITTTASGLQFEVITEGAAGDKPTAESTVRVHYHGTLIDGAIFDSSVDRGQPAEFPVGGVIKGWTEALQLMTPGSKYKLHIPHHLAYGEQGAGGAIAPFAALVFEVELLEIIA